MSSIKYKINIMNYSDKLVPKQKFWLNNSNFSLIFKNKMQTMTYYEQSLDIN